MDISLIVAMSKNRVIGDNGRIPWRLPAEQRYFKRVTMGKPLVFGRKTYESIGRPLPGRENIILTRNPDYQAPGCTVVHTVAEVIDAAGSAPELMIGGGAYIYRLFYPLATRIYLTVVDLIVQGDTNFLDYKTDEWQTLSEQTHSPDKRNPLSYTISLLHRKTA